MFVPDTPASRPEVNQRVQGRTVQVHTAGRARYQAQALRVDADSTTWTDPSGRSFCAIGNDAIVSLKVPRPGRGALVGIGVGAPVGLIAGFLYGAVRFGSTDNDVGKAVVAVTTPALAGIGALVGLATGAVVGAVSGKDAYRAPGSEAPPSMAAPVCRPK